jgi:hypothetical protein
LSTTTISKRPLDRRARSRCSAPELGLFQVIAIVASGKVDSRLQRARRGVPTIVPARELDAPAPLDRALALRVSLSTRAAGEHALERNLESRASPRARPARDASSSEAGARRPGREVLVQLDGSSPPVTA